MKHALVTGAASGIGRETTLALIAAGYHVFALDVSRGDLRRLAKVCGDAVTPIPVDLRKKGAISNVFARLRAKRFRFTLVVNNAGIAMPDRLDLPTSKAWDAILETNLLAVWLVAREALPLMAKGAMLVNVASSAAKFPMKFQAAYSAAKAGVAAFSQALREEWLERGIRVTTIFPGPTKTGILRSFPARFLREHRVWEEPRLEARDVAQAILFAARQPEHASLDEILLTPSRWSTM